MVLKVETNGWTRVIKKTSLWNKGVGIFHGGVGKQTSPEGDDRLCGRCRLVCPVAAY